MSSPEATFRTMQAYVRDGKYEKVWSLLSSEARQQWVQGVNEHKHILETAEMNRKELERLIQDQYGLDGPSFLRATPEELYARVMWKGADGMALLEIAGPARITGDRALLPYTKKMLAGGTYPTSELPFVLKSGRWALAKIPLNADVADTSGIRR